MRQWPLNILNERVPLREFAAVNNWLYENFWSEIQIDLKCEWHFKFALHHFEDSENCGPLFGILAVGRVGSS